MQKDDHYVQFEYPEKRTTIMVQESLFPAEDVEEVIQTNWFALAPTVGYLNCKITRSGRHYGCSKTRSGEHYGLRSVLRKVKGAGAPATKQVCF